MYSVKISNLLKKKKIKIGDKIRIKKDEKAYEGILMPRVMGDKDTIIIKLDNGYNVGFKPKEVELISKAKKQKKETKKILKKDPKKPNITIISMGGTIASKIDYKTGAVTPLFSAEDLIDNIPELGEIANVDGKVVAQKLSENLNFQDYKKLINEIKKEFGKTDGVIITHGTDTLHYTAAALSFAIENSPVPIILVGSQRSSDRASSDGPMNLICAAHFITKTEFSGVAISMHATESDDFCFIFPACKTRKMHTSRRDAFKTVNSKPWAMVYPDGKIKFIRKIDKNKGKTKIRNKFEEKVALIKTYPNMDTNIINFLTKNKYKGLVLEGTGLGHAPLKIIKSLEKFLKKGIVVMTSQCLNGRVNMNVYSAGRELQEIGVIPGEDMLPEVAYIKLSWLLGNYKNKDEIKELLRKNLRGEINERSGF